MTAPMDHPHHGSGKPHILFVHPGASAFVREDLRILGGMADLAAYSFSVNRNGPRLLLVFRLARHFLQQLFWLCRHRKADLVYCWFADYHSLLPAWFARWHGIPCITVLGGYDCNRLRHLDYGVYQSWQKPFATRVIRHSTLLLPVDRTLIRTDPAASGWPEAHPNGLEENVPGFDTPWEAVPTGYDPGRWKMGPADRGKTACTVALCNTLRTARVKGIDLVILAAEQLPEYSFQVVGVSAGVQAELEAWLSPPDNVTFTGPLPRQELGRVYESSAVYLQLSRTEGLPNVLCEAMLCGCIPVGSPVFGIPAAIGDTGYIAPTPDPGQIAGQIKQAERPDRSRRLRARKRIEKHYSLEKREKRLREILSRHLADLKAAG